MCRNLDEKLIGQRVQAAGIHDFLELWFGSIGMQGDNTEYSSRLEVGSGYVRIAVEEMELKVEHKKLDSKCTSSRLLC